MIAIMINKYDGLRLFSYMLLKIEKTFIAKPVADGGICLLKWKGIHSNYINLMDENTANYYYQTTEESEHCHKLVVNYFGEI